MLLKLYFRHACIMGLEEPVSKHRDSAYRAGRFDRWIKVKNRHAPLSARDGSVLLGD